MPKRQEFQENEYYHIYNRWKYKQTLFYDLKDSERFLYYIDMYRERCKNKIWLIAYCILPNHFHFVLHNQTKSHKISYFIWNICAAYTRYYKAKYWTEKGSSFFESRFKSKHLSNEQYLSQCIKYVEFNPIKHELVSNIEDRIFTSYDPKKYQGKPSLDNKESIKEILEFDWEF